MQTAENLYAHGIIDAVLPPEEIADILDRALAILLAPRRRRRAGARADPARRRCPTSTTWDAVTRSRRPDRPGVRRLLRYAASDVIPLNGTGQGEHDPGCCSRWCASARRRACSSARTGAARPPTTRWDPEALREARRGMRLASELGLPLVTVIDTQGAALSAEAENGGLAGEIARCLADLVTLDAPTLCLMLGEGNGGGALALLPADRVIAAQHAWLSPLPPEGASAIVHRDLDHAPEMARAQQVRALDLHDRGIVDRIVAEQPDAADEPEEFCQRVGAVLEHELGALLDRPGPGTAGRAGPPLPLGRGHDRGQLARASARRASCRPCGGGTPPSSGSGTAPRRPPGSYGRRRAAGRPAAPAG